MSIVSRSYHRQPGSGQQRCGPHGRAASRARNAYLARRIPDLKLDRLALKLDGADFLRGRAGNVPSAHHPCQLSGASPGSLPCHERAGRRLRRSQAALTKSTPIVLM